MFPLKLTRIKSVLDYNYVLQKRNITSAYDNMQEKWMFV